jgi:hypothetical protein
MNQAEWVLRGLDGGNPLAFLAALGTLRSLTLAWGPGRTVRMSWKVEGAWRPVLHLDRPASSPEIVEALDNQLKRMQGHPLWSIGPDLKATPKDFGDYANRAVSQLHSDGDRTWADFVAAFGCEATTTDSGLIQDTALRTMSGAGHQHFVQSMALIVDRAGPEHLEKALFHPWRYDDAVEKQTLRWDPVDDVRRALRWRDPSGDPRRKRRGGMLGANRLAIEALPLLPTIPRGRDLHTTGFTSPRRRPVEWTWPIWSEPIGVDLARSVLAHPSLAELPGDARMRDLAEIGIVEVYRSRRLTIDKFRCFTPAYPL